MAATHKEAEEIRSISFRRTKFHCKCGCRPAAAAKPAIVGCRYHELCYTSIATITRNPSVAARFSNIYMKAFLKCILGYGPKAPEDEEDGGVLGVVDAYYGNVEAQGRRSLHCHMMLWLASSLNPNEIKDKALEGGGNVEFQKRLIAFLEDTISASVPPDVDRTDLSTPLCKCHPCATCGPGPTISPEDEQDAAQRDLHVRSCGGRSYGV
ncbi:hypothetical protein B0H19DRAFT_1079505 [Mycena capillaripes]|nr:hypothetical protein B0H19DRAFT_1079505 [Mycena capillaripes]